LIKTAREASARVSVLNVQRKSAPRPFRLSGADPGKLLVGNPRGRTGTLNRPGLRESKRDARMSTDFLRLRTRSRTSVHTPRNSRQGIAKGNGHLMLKVISTQHEALELGPRTEQRSMTTGATIS
jgi:hypothetical protein